MTRKDLPFQPWGIKAIAEGRKLLTSRCSGLAAVNRNPDEWVLMDCLCDAFGIVRARFGSLKESSKEVMCECPWRLSRVYPPANVLVTGIIAKRVQDMTEEDLRAEGFPTEWCDCGLPDCGNHKDGKWDFIKVWDSIHRRDVNNRYNRNPWTFRLSVRKT